MTVSNTSKTKHTADLHRLLRIITLVQADSAWSPKKLTEELGVTERTVYRDIEKLKSVGIPIRYDRRQRGYRINGEFFLQPIAGGDVVVCNGGTVTTSQWLRDGDLLRAHDPDTGDRP